MAVQVIVEDGTGLEYATSYIEVSQMDDFWEQMGYTLDTELDATAKRQLVNRSTLYLDGYRNWGGIPSTAEQALAFPRTGLVTTGGYTVYGVPNDIKKAQACMAFWLTDKGVDNIAPISAPNGDIKESEIEVGKVKERYVYFEGTATSSEIVTIPEVDAILSKYSANKYGALYGSQLGGNNIPINSRNSTWYRNPRYPRTR